MPIVCAIKGKVKILISSKRDSMLSAFLATNIKINNEVVFIVKRQLMLPNYDGKNFYYLTDF